MLDFLLFLLLRNRFCEEPLVIIVIEDMKATAPKKGETGEACAATNDLGMKPVPAPKFA